MLRVMASNSAEEVLCVEAHPQPGILRKAYRRLCLLLHPDKNLHPDAEKAFKKLSAAFQALADVVSDTSAPDVVPAAPTAPPSAPVAFTDKPKASYKRPSGKSRGFQVKVAPVKASNVSRNTCSAASASVSVERLSSDSSDEESDGESDDGAVDLLFEAEVGSAQQPARLQSAPALVLYPSA